MGGETREVKTTELRCDRHCLGARSKSAVLSLDFELRSQDHTHLYVRVQQRKACVWVMLQIPI
jgi:hypothetical protein